MPSLHRIPIHCLAVAMGNLGLGAGGAGGDLGTVGGDELEDVARLVAFEGGGVVGGQVVGLAGEVVEDGDDGRAPDGGGRGSAEGTHHLLDLFGALLALFG